MGETDLALKRRRRRTGLRRTAGIAAAILVLFAVGAAAGIWLFLRSMYRPSDDGQTPPAAGISGRVNVLVMGLDGGVNGNGKIPSQSLVHTSRADTMMVVSFDPELKKVGILSIPRDTRVRIPGRNGYDKVAHAHAYGGPKLAMETVESLIGEKVPYYVRVDFKAFVSIVDLIGGIEMNVEQDMDYEDPYQNLYIHIKKGKQVLNGEKALQFVRYRQYPNGDIDRVKAQQKLLQAAMKSFFEMDTLWKLPAIAKEAASYIDTNIEPGMMISLANTARQVKKEDVAMAIVPGQPADIVDASGYAVSYWVADQQKLQKAVDLLVRGIDRDANGKVRVEVLNGTQTTGAASKVSELLREHGYLVLRVANSDKPVKGSTVLVNGTDGGIATGVARTIARVCPQVRVSSGVGTSDVDVTVIVGSDFKE